MPDVVFAAFKLAPQPRPPPVLPLAPAAAASLLLLEPAHLLPEPASLLLKFAHAQLPRLRSRPRLVGSNPGDGELLVQLLYVLVLGLKPSTNLVGVLNLGARLLLRSVFRGKLLLGGAFRRWILIYFVRSFALVLVAPPQTNSSSCLTTLWMFHITLLSVRGLCLGLVSGLALGFRVVPRFSASGSPTLRPAPLSLLR